MFDHLREQVALPFALLIQIGLRSKCPEVGLIYLQSLPALPWRVTLPYAVGTHGLCTIRSVHIKILGENRSAVLMKYHSLYMINFSYKIWELLFVLYFNLKNLY